MTPHQLRVGRPRPIRLAEAGRPLPGDLLRPRQVARLAVLRRGPGTASHDGPGVRDRALPAAPARFPGRERAVHPDPAEARRPLADPPRPHVPGSQTMMPPASRLPIPALLALVAACTAPGKGMIALEGATLIDGSGGPPIADAVILVRNGHIEAVGQVNELKVPRGAERISLLGKTIIPGLIDAHAHVQRWAIPRYLAWGVTTVRDVGNDNDTAFALKTELTTGSVLGPRMFTAGAMIDGVPATYPTATAVATGDEARKTVDQRALAGADYLKIYTKITPELLRPLVDEARTLRLPVAAHLGKTDALTAAKAGVISLEHMAGVVQAAARNPRPYFVAHSQFLAGWTLEEQGWASLDSVTVARTARALAATHVAIVPTLVLHETLAHLGDAALLARPAMADVPADAGNVVRQVASLLRRSNWRSRDFTAFRRSRPVQ